MSGWDDPLFVVDNLLLLLFWDDRDGGFLAMKSSAYVYV